MKRNIELDNNKDEILRLYLEENKTYKEIAEIFNTSLSSIATRVQKWGKANSDSNRYNRKEIPKDVLYDMYWNQEMHPRQIGDVFGCSFSTVHNYMKKYGIPTRTKSESRMGKLNPIYEVGHTEEARKKMSSAFINGRKRGYNSCWGNTSKYITPKQGIVTMRSSWECKVADYLTALGIEWLYEPKVFKLTGIISYKPDFYIEKDDYYIEVKGRLKRSDKEKIRLFKEKGYELEVWDGEELLRLGLITNSGSTEINRKYRKRRI